MLEEQIFLYINYTLKNIKVCSFHLHLEDVEEKNKKSRARQGLTSLLFLFSKFFLMGRCECD